MGTGGGREIGSSDVCSCGSGEVYTLGETLGSEYGAEEGSSGEMSIEELKDSAMGESLGSEYGTEVGASKVMSEGNIDIKVRVYSGLSNKVVRVELYEEPLKMVAGALSVVLVMEILTF